MEMEDRPQEGFAWVAGLKHAWGACNNLAYHIHWHSCLFLRGQGDAAAVLRHYDSDVRGDQSEEYLDISNAVALLWRLEQRGIDVGGRWIELAEKAARLGSDHQLVFADAHYRSEEHTSELQSLMRISYAVFCLKKKKRHIH